MQLAVFSDQVGDLKIKKLEIFGHRNGYIFLKPCIHFSLEDHSLVILAKIPINNMNSTLETNEAYEYVMNSLLFILEIQVSQPMLSWVSMPKIHGPIKIYYLQLNLGQELVISLVIVSDHMIRP